jgi:hypothetical protein
MTMSKEARAAGKTVVLLRVANYQCPPIIHATLDVSEFIDEALNCNGQISANSF